jgi:phosphoribosylglycinamide formyltransferase-1
LKKSEAVRIAIFASGGGSNAHQIIRQFDTADCGEVVLVCTNNPKAGVIAIAEAAGIPVRILTREIYQDAQSLGDLLAEFRTDLLVLAGYLKLIPAGLVALYPKRIVNIHPALLPKFGGKGMYGMNVHRAVINAGEKRSGMTIHYIDERYDEGEILLQKSLAVKAKWSPEQLQKAVLRLEHRYFPEVIENLCKNLQKKP